MTSTEKQWEKTFWADHIQRWHKSDLSQAAYCLQHDLCQQKFSYRKRQSITHHTIKPIDPSGFTHLQVDHPVSPSPQAGLSLRLANGTCIEGITANNVVLLQPLLAVLS